MKSLFYTLILAALGAAAAKADTISIAFDKPNMVAPAGANLVFTGTITNLTSSTIFLNSDYYTLAGTGYTFNDQFFNTVPISLAPGANSGDIELFDVQVPASPGATQSTGTYGLTGGTDGNAANNLGSSSFNITPSTPTSAPEIDPSLASSGLVLVIGGIAVLRGRRLRLTA